MASLEAEKYVENLIADYSEYHKFDDELTALTSAYWENIPVKLDDVLEAFDAGAESEKKKVEWHNLKENPNDLPPAQGYESEGSIDHWKWYLVKTDYTDYRSCHYAICARVLMPRYSDGVDEPIWKENSGNDIGDEHIFEWREL